MKRIAKMLSLFLASAFIFSAASAQNGRGNGKQKEKKVVVYKDGTVINHTTTTVKTKNGKTYAYGKTKTTPPGYIKGKKVGWTKGKGNKH
jgi:hypothetical protein